MLLMLLPMMMVMATVMVTHGIAVLSSESCPLLSLIHPVSQAMYTVVLPVRNPA